VHATFEEGTHAAWLYDLLASKVAKLVVCNPRKNALLKLGQQKRCHRRAQTCRVIARRNAIAGLSRRAERTRSPATARSYTMLTEDTTRVMNRLKAVFRGQAVSCAGKKLYAKRHRDGYLAELGTGGAAAACRVSVPGV